MVESRPGTHGGPRYLRVLSAIRVVISVFIAVALGLIGFSLIFADLGPAESPIRRQTFVVLFHFLAGFILGLFNSRIWPVVALVAWAGIFLGIAGMVTGNSGSERFQSLLLFLMTLGPTMLGGFLGSLVMTGRLFRRAAQSRQFRAGKKR